MTVRFLVAPENFNDDMKGGRFTKNIADVFEHFEDYGEFRRAQAETLETALLYMWSQFNRIGDVTVLLNEQRIHMYTSNTSMYCEGGWLHSRINFRGDIHFTVSNGRQGGDWGTLVFTPSRELRWDRFVDKVRLNVAPRVYGHREEIIREPLV